MDLDGNETMAEGYYWFKGAEYAWKIKRFFKPLANWVHKRSVQTRIRKYSVELVRILNSLFPDKVKVYRITGTVPVVRNDGNLATDPNLEDHINGARKELSKRGDRNEMQAIVQSEYEEQLLLNIIDYKIADYATAKSLRDMETPANVLTSGAVVFCSSTQEIFLHKRAQLDTYGKKLHIHGGAFRPASGADDGDGDLLDACERELREELGVKELTLSRRMIPPIAIAKELDTGYVQVVFLGVDLDEETARNVKEQRKEGNNIRVQFDDLENQLRIGDWAPSGKVHILGWLGLGSPGLRPLIRFRSLTARELFKHLVDTGIAA